MLNLSSEQLTQIATASPAMLRTAIGNLVQAEHPYVLQGLPRDLFDEMVGAGLEAARSHGLQAPKDLATFVLLQFEVGPEFHRHPAIKPVLADPAIAPADRLEAVLARTPDAVWNEIESLLHRQTWFPALRQLEAS